MKPWAGLGLTLAIAGCATTPPQRATWFMVETENFDVLCGLPHELCVELSSDAERFRAAVAHLSGRPLTRSSVPVRLFAFDGRGIERPFLVNDAVGYFLEDPGGPVVVLRAGRGWRKDAGLALQHDLAHYLLRLQAPRPLWAEEGIAQVASTLWLDDDHTVIGEDHPQHRAWLRDRGVRSLLPTLTAADLSHHYPAGHRRFDAESWAVVHLLSLGPPPSGRPEGAGPPDVVAAPLPDADELTDAVNALARKDAITTVHLPADAQVDAGPAAHPIARAEGLTRMGRLALMLERPELADRFLSYALVLEPDHVPAHAALAVAKSMRQDWRAADAHAERALALEPESVAAQLGAARVELARATLDGDAEALARARAHLDRCVELAPEEPECQARLADALLASGDLAPALAHAEQAAALTPGLLESQLRVAEVLFRKGETGRAQELSAGVASRSHEPARVRSARELLAEISTAQARE